jgi:hypothetical protein
MHTGDIKKKVAQFVSQLTECKPFFKKIRLVVYVANGRSVILLETMSQVEFFITTLLFSKHFLSS